MNDSADMKQTSLKDAALALKAAVSALEESLDPLIVNHAKLKTQAREAESFSEDRVKLAAQLDDALESRKVREAEFESLSKQTREELDATIEVLQQVLSGDD
jgi:hypothetical protein